MPETNPITLANDAGFSLYYRHSGRAPLAPLLVALAASLAVAIPAAALYSACDIYIPSVKLRWFLALGLGVVLGRVPAAILRRCNIRNNSRCMLVILLVTLCGYYFTWIAWLWILFSRAGDNVPITAILAHPDHVWNTIQSINTEGTWSLGSDSNVSGTFLWLIWLLEAATIIGTSLAIGWKSRGTDPFCESCGVWCAKPREIGFSAMRDVKELKAQLESGQFAAAGPLQAVPPVASKWMTYHHHTCPKCGQLNTLTVNMITISKTKKGQVSRAVKTVIDKLLMHPGEAEQMLPAPAAVPTFPPEPPK